MQPATPTFWPTFLTAGTSFAVDRSFPQYDTASWSYMVYLVGAQVLSAAGSPDAALPLYHVTLSAAQLATLNPSGGASLAYTLVERLTDTTTNEIIDVHTQRIMISPNVATASAGDFVSPEEKILGQLQATLAARITGGAVESYSIAGRSITKISTKELRDMIGSYKWLVWRQRNPGKISVPGAFSFPVDRSTGPGLPLKFPGGY